MPDERRVLVRVNTKERHRESPEALAARLGEAWSGAGVDTADVGPVEPFTDAEDGETRFADEVLDEIVNEAATITGARAARFHVFGYGAGGRFALRYAMAHPERVAACAFAAAGWYTHPDPTSRYPYGLAGDALPVRFVPERFLRVPMLALVGEGDRGRDDALRASRRRRSITSAESVRRSRRRRSRISTEGGRMNTVTASGIDSRTCCAPCQSISRMTLAPSARWDSTCERLVP